MRLPIQYAFSYPGTVGGAAAARWTSPAPARSSSTRRTSARFPCLALAYRALEAEARLPVVLNAANEVAVEAFLDGRSAFTAIADVIATAMDAHTAAPVATLAAVRAVDAMGPGARPSAWPGR